MDKEKYWNQFEATGSVTDYLSYKFSSKENSEHTGGQQHGTANQSQGYGTVSHACR